MLFLTARDALPDRLAGFAAGGDDYLTKPFAFAELVARLRPWSAAGSTRRSRPGAACSSTRAAHDDARLGDRLADADRVPAAGASGGEAGALVRRRELVDAGWPHGAIVHDNTLDVYIARLRRKLGRLDGAPRIVTTHGVGYGIR